MALETKGKPGSDGIGRTPSRRYVAEAVGPGSKVLHVVGWPIPKHAGSASRKCVVFTRHDLFVRLPPGSVGEKGQGLKTWSRNVGGRHLSRYQASKGKPMYS